MSLIGQQPRYLQVAQTLLSEVRDGLYRVGDLLPTEHELCARFGASRFTIRQALGQLSQLGMVTRQSGVGTRLVSAEARTIYRQGLESVADILQYAADTELQVLGSQQITLEPGELASLLGASAGQEWRQVEAVRRSVKTGDLPIGFTEIYLPPAFTALRGLEGQVADAVYRMIEEQFGERVVEVRQELRAGALPLQAARVLGAKANSPCLWITRHYLNARANAVEVTRSVHPGERFTYQQTFRQTPSSG